MFQSSWDKQQGVVGENFPRSAATSFHHHSSRDLHRRTSGSFLHQNAPIFAQGMKIILILPSLSLKVAKPELGPQGSVKLQKSVFHVVLK